MKIYFASDHAGFALKGVLVPYVRDELGYEVVDEGAHVYHPDDDYPDFIILAARAVSADPHTTRAIVLGGSGQGEAMVANRFPHVRALVYYGGMPIIPALGRTHNDANVLSLGARFLQVEEAKIAVQTFLETPFSEEARHVRRIAHIDNVAS